MGHFSDPRAEGYFGVQHRSCYPWPHTLDVPFGMHLTVVINCPILEKHVKLNLGKNRQIFFFQTMPFIEIMLYSPRAVQTY